MKKLFFLALMLSGLMLGPPAHAFVQLTQPTISPLPLTVVCAGAAAAPSQYIAQCAGAVTGGDQATINTAITAAATAGGQTVQLGPGTFYLSSAVNAAANVTIEGSGRGATTLYVANGANDNAINCTAINNFHVRNLSVNGNYANQTNGGLNDSIQNGIRFNGCTNSSIDTVETYGAYAHGVFENDVTTGGNGSNNQFNNIITHNNGQIGMHVHADNSGVQSVRFLTISNVISYSNSQVANPYGAGKQYGGFYVEYIGDSGLAVSNIVSHDESGPCFSLSGTFVAGVAVASSNVFSNLIAYNCGTDQASGVAAAVLLQKGLTNTIINNLSVFGTTGLGSDCIDFSSTNAPITGVTINGFNLLGCGRNGIYDPGTYADSGIKLIHGYISSGTGIGIQVVGNSSAAMADWTLEDVTVDGQASYAAYFNGNSSFPFSGVHMDNIHYALNGNGVRCDYCNDSSFTGSGGTDNSPGETLTIAGTLTIGDTMALTATGGTITGSPVTVTYTTIAADTSTTMATGLTALVNANSALTTAGISAIQNGAVVVLNYPTSLTVAWSKAVGGSATETMTLAAGGGQCYQENHALRMDVRGNKCIFSTRTSTNTQMSADANSLNNKWSFNDCQVSSLGCVFFQGSYSIIDHNTTTNSSGSISNGSSSNGNFFEENFLDESSGVQQCPYHADRNGSPTVRDLFVCMPGQLNQVRVVIAAGAVTAALSDAVIVVNKTSGAATTVNLPSSPPYGTTLTIKDGKGDAATNNITVTPAAGNIDGAGTYVMNTNYQAISITYNGTQWNVD